MTIPDRVTTHGMIDAPQARTRSRTAMIDLLSIKTPGPSLPVASLSGGNQQKVVMARALASDPKLLVLITPTAGVDVRSKEALLEAVGEARARRDAASSIVSDDLDELRPCDRVFVMFQRTDRAHRSSAAGRTVTSLLQWKESPMSDAGAQGASPRRERGRTSTQSRGGAAAARSPGCATSPWCRRSSSIAIVGYIVNPVFLSFDNIINILQSMSEIGVLVLAETLILLMGRIDLSLESTFGLAPGVAAWLTVAPGVAHGLGWLGGGVGRPDLPGGRRARRRDQRAAHRPLPAQRLHRHARHADHAARPARRASARARRSSSSRRR